MKRFLKALATFSLIEAIGRQPALAAGMMLIGLGGAVVVGNFTTPAIRPQVSSIFGTTQGWGVANNVLLPNAGTAGAFAFPSSNTGGFVIYGEGTIDAAFQSNEEWALSATSQGLDLLGAGQTFRLNRILAGQQNRPWWLGLATSGAASSVGGTGYAQGYYPFTATGGGCAREPSGVWNQGVTGGFGPSAVIVDPGFLCPTEPTIDVSTIPLSGARRATGLAASPPLAATSCAVVNGLATVTAKVTVAHGMNPGLTYTMQGFGTGFTGYNGTYTALTGTAGTTLVGTTGATSCPTSPVDLAAHEGSALSGTGGSITLPPISIATGITTHNGQHICFAFGEDGSDSAFPGGQFMTAVDEQGNALPGSPALVPWLNEGNANFTGYLVTGASSTPTLNVTAMKPYVISAATYAAASGSTPAEVTFTTTTSPGFVPGSEFTVSGLSSTSGNVNLTYVAVAGTSGTTIVGNPLSGPFGTPSPLANPGTISSASSPQLVSVIMPSMSVLGGTFGNVIAPFGTSSGTGTGGVGTYALTGTQSAATFTAKIDNGSGSGGNTLTVTVAPGDGTALVVGSTVTGAGVTAGTVITALGSAAGGVGTYTVNNSQLVATAESMTNAGTVGSVGAPVTIFAYPGYYYTAAASSTPSGGVLTTIVQAGPGDFVTAIGGPNSNPETNGGGWGGALGNIAMLYGATPQPSTADMASLCKKQTTLTAYATSHSLTVNSLYALNDPGIWGDSSLWAGKAVISGASGSTATFHVSSTQYGTSPTTGTIAGPGIPGCPQACPTLTGSTLTWASAIAANMGSSGSPVAMTAGAWKPATGNGSNSVNGYIDSPSGVPTLHVTSVGTGFGFAQFTGTLGSGIAAFIDDGSNSPNPSGHAGNVLTVVSPVDEFDSSPVVGVGTTITGAGVTAGTVITALRTGRGFGGTYTVNNSQLVGFEGMAGGGILPGFPTSLNTSGVTGALSQGTIIADGGVSIKGSPLLVNGAPFGSAWPVNGSYYQAIGPETMYGTITTLVPGQYLANSSISTPTKILKYGTLSNCPTTGFPMCGTFILSACPNSSCAVGSPGAPVAITTTSVSDGGAIAPGPALTIKDLGPGVTFPVDTATGLGTISISGTYNVSALGGTPTSIQAQISNTANGPPISGCTACAWTNLSSPTLTGGTWSGQVVNIPAAAGPLYVSVCVGNATPACSTNNGTAYATLPNFVKIGLIYDLQANGIGGGLISGESGTALNYYTGLWGINKLQGAQAEYTAGPPILPNLGNPVQSNFAPTLTVLTAGDRFGLNGQIQPVLGEGIGAMTQNLTTAFGWPVTIDDWARDGTGVEAEALGNIQQNQTIALADGTKTSWCSSSTFCANASVSGTLFFNAATLTGATMNGASIASGVLSFPATGAFPSGTGVGLWQGALEPGMVLSGDGITGSPTLLYCKTGCTISSYPASGGASLAAQTWQTSNSGLNASTGTIRADLPAGGLPGGVSSPASIYPLQQAQGVPLVPGGQAFSFQIMQAGTFKISVNGTVVCQDTQTFLYNNTSGNCTTVTNGFGLAISSSFVNYQTGDYSVTFSSAPAANSVISATWTNIISPEPVFSNASPLAASQSRPTGIDFMGDGTFQSGAISSVFAKTPGGVNGHIFSGCATNGDILMNGNLGYEFMAPGYSQWVSYLYNTRFPSTIPGVSASTPFIPANQARTQGAIFVGGNPNGDQMTCNAWSIDVALKSTFTGTIASNVLTLTAPAVGPMWEGEVLAGSGVGPGVYIQSLATGSWGASGSTYNLNGSPANVSSPTAMHNATYYIGTAPVIYAGNLPDVTTQAQDGLQTTTVLSPHLIGGFAGGRRIGARWAAEIWEGINHNLPISSPTVDRTKSGGCDSSALASPCFDVSNGSATATASWTTAGVFTVTGGLAAHARPFVVGQVVQCSPACGSGLVITSLSVPPTQSTATGAGEVGQTFAFKTGVGTLPSSNSSGAVNGVCSGSGGAGSNCIDVAFVLNAPGATSLDTCGANNLNGTAPNYNQPNGVCSGNGVGEIVRDFRIGTQQCMLCFTPGSVYMDGADVYNNMTFNQSAAFTCNIIPNLIVQCVKGPSYTKGVPSAIGRWASGSTYIDYGETSFDGGSRIATVMGYAGGQSFPITSGGSGYTNGVYAVTASCPTLAAGTFPGTLPGVAPTFDVSVSGGKIVDIYPSATVTNSAGMGVGPSAPASPTACSIPLTSITCTGGSCGGVVPDIIVAPTEGVGGVGTFNTDSNSTGVLLYDNSGEPSGPLNSFFTNGGGGYFEPGLPVTPFGGFKGAQVSG